MKDEIRQKGDFAVYAAERGSVGDRGKCRLDAAGEDTEKNDNLRQAS